MISKISLERSKNFGRLMFTIFECSSIKLTTSLCPFLQANINAVLPKSSFALSSMLRSSECSNINLTISVCPNMQAHINAVIPKKCYQIFNFKICQISWKNTSTTVEFTNKIIKVKNCEFNLFFFINSVKAVVIPPVWFPRTRPVWTAAAIPLLKEKAEMKNLKNS